MFCSKCGKQLADDAAFCVACGARVNESPVTVENEEPVTYDSQTLQNTETVNEEPQVCVPQNNVSGDFTSQNCDVHPITEMNQPVETSKKGNVWYILAIVFGALSFIPLLSFVFLLPAIVFAIVGLCKNKGTKKVLKIVSSVVVALSLVVNILMSALIIELVGEMLDSDSDDDDYSPSYNTVTLYSAYSDTGCSSPYASYGVDYISVDTNPYNYDSDSTNASKYAATALSKIQALNSKFGFPSYVYEDMIGTRALDGRQSYVGTNFSASWRYHPDSGLEVMYTEN